MKKHTVFVAGRRFILLSEEKKEYVEKVAQEVNDAIVAISSQNPTLDSRSCAILCALDQADDKYKEVLKNQRLSERATEVMKHSDKNAKSVKELKDEIKKAKTLNEKQLHQIADSNVEIKTLTEKVKENSSENAKLKEKNENLTAENKKNADENKKLTSENKKITAENKKLQEEIEKLKKQIEADKKDTKTPEKKEVKNQPFQNPVAKVTKATTENKKTQVKEKMNQMSLFENE